MYSHFVSVAGLEHRMSMKAFTTLFVFLFTVGLYGQAPGPIHGRFETRESLSLSGLSLRFISEKEVIWASTDPNGEFTVILPPGKYKLTIDPSSLYNFTAFISITETGPNPDNVKFTADPGKVCCQNDDGSPFPKLIEFPKPPFPPAAAAVRANGEVIVNVEIDRSGAVTSAAAISGHPLLRLTAEAIARKARFEVSSVDLPRSAKLVYYFDSSRKQSAKSVYSNAFRKIIENTTRIIDSVDYSAGTKRP
jgi:hypothetical protein